MTARGKVTPPGDPALADADPPGGRRAAAAACAGGIVLAAAALFLGYLRESRQVAAGSDGG